jgi:hypothetical protein
MRLIGKNLLLTAFLWLAACDSDPVELRLVAPSSDLDLEIVQNLEGLLDQSTAVRIQISPERPPWIALLGVKRIWRWSPITCPIVRTLRL